MEISDLLALQEEIEKSDGRKIKSDIVGNYEDSLQEVLGQGKFLEIVNSKKGVKSGLLQALEKEIEAKLTTDINDPERKKQQEAITRGEVQRVDRLPLNAKLHLLKNNTLLNNLQLAFSNPSDYIEFAADKFVGTKNSKKDDEIKRAIWQYMIIDPRKAKRLYEKLGLSISLADTEKLKKLLSEAKLHQYTTSHKVESFRKITTPRLSYIQGYPMLFGKNLVHTQYGHNSTRAEQSKYDIDTGAKIFNDFYRLIRAHSHIQDSEQAGIDALTELNIAFAEAAYIIKDKNKRQELEILIQDIIDQIGPKEDSKVKKAKNQDLLYILENHHIIRNNNKLQAAHEKIRRRITAQQQIKNTVAIQQNALYEDLAQQAVYAREYIKLLHQHINNFDTKNRSARKLAQSYENKLYAKPFYDLHDFVIQLEDQAQLHRWMPHTLKIKLEIYLLLQRRYMNILWIENHYKIKNTMPSKRVVDLPLLLEGQSDDLSPLYKDLLQTAQDITDPIYQATQQTIENIVDQAHSHLQKCKKKLLESGK